jgi:iron complex outermembrane receptor protein
MDVGATLNVPLGETTAARLSVLSLNRDGYGERADGQELGDIERQVGRLQLRWTPSDDLDVNLAVDGARKREHQGVRSLVFVNPNAPLAFLENAFVQPFDQRYIPSNPYDSFATASNTDELDAWGAALNVDWTVGGLKVQSITAYRTQDSTTGQDGDQSPANMIQFDEKISSDQLSHEDHVGGSAFGERLDWLTGIILFREEADQQTLSLQVPDLAPIIGDLTRLDRYSITNTSYGVFGEATWHVSDRLGLTAGLRYTHEKKEWSYDFRHALTGTPILPPGDLDDSWDPVTPRLGLEFRPSEAVLTYASVAKGFRSGGFNARATSATGIQSFDPETVMTYELGVKSQLLEDRLRVNASVFYSDYKDIQLLIASASAGGGFEVRTENAASAEIKGAELELTAKPLHGFEASIGIGYMDSSIEESAPGTGVAVGNVLMETPEWSGTASLQYTFALAGLGEMLLRADYSYRSEIYHDAANTPTLLTDGYGLANARIGFASAGGAWNLAAFVTNVADEEYRVTGFDASIFGFADAAWGRPREFGASVTYRF